MLTAIRLIIISTLVVSCDNGKPFRDPIIGSYLDPRFGGFDSIEELRDYFNKTLSQKREHDGYTLYHITDEPFKYLFVKIGNCPRGLAMFSLYCYQQADNNHWQLRGYMPVNYGSLIGQQSTTNLPVDRLKFAAEGGYLNVFFRDSLIFTLKNKAWLSPTTDSKFLPPTMVETAKPKILP